MAAGSAARISFTWSVSLRPSRRKRWQGAGTASRLEPLQGDPVLPDPLARQRYSEMCRIERSYTARTSPGNAPRPGQRLGSPHASEGADGERFPRMPRKQSSPGASGLPDPALRSPFADDCQRMGTPLQPMPTSQLARACHSGTQTGDGSGQRPQAQATEQKEHRSLATCLTSTAWFRKPPTRPCGARTDSVKNHR